MVAVGGPAVEKEEGMAGGGGWAAGGRNKGDSGRRTR